MHRSYEKLLAPRDLGQPAGRRAVRAWRHWRCHHRRTSSVDPGSKAQREQEKKHWASLRWCPSILTGFLVVQTQLEIAGKGALECRPQGSPFRVQSRGGDKEKNREVRGRSGKPPHPARSLLSLSPPERVFWGWLVVSWFSSLLECQLHKDRDLSSCNLGTTPALGNVPGTGQILHNCIK